MNYNELKDFISEFAAEGIGAVAGFVIGAILGPAGSLIGGIVGGVFPVVFKFVSRAKKGNGVLILEDDPIWLSRHEEKLKEAGLKVYATRIPSEAIELFNNNKSIRFAFLDQVLKVPDTETIQNDSGIDVAREIHLNARDSGREAIIYLVTESTQIKVNDQILIDPRRMADLEVTGTVHKVISKISFDIKGGDTYRKIIRDIKKN
jgi:CheY-like chemotaxis protein